MKCFKIHTLKYSLRAFLNKKDKNQNLIFLKKCIKQLYKNLNSF